MSTVDEQRIFIPGPAGQLEAIAAIPDTYNTHHAVAIVCHPHPLHGGSMQNKVVHTLAKTFSGFDVPTIRFNFRGVGKSAGTFDDAVGEIDDALAVIKYALGQFPGHDVWLGGFSFGAYISLRVAQQQPITQLVTVAPAVNLYALENYTPPSCPWLLIQGDEDEIVPLATVQSWTQTIKPSPEVKIIPQTGHFFHGKLLELRDIISLHIKHHL